ncbi:flap endonuclease-1 [Candidatus Micrarchaeota archaeon RBG_16_49_10]|nr:MAG: flap endonuclease-1 [Candidatus Micrarchaeota archaeon RBG_16_49_10]
MGVQLTSIIPKEGISLDDLRGKKIAVDAFNTIFQFLSIIRHRDTGELLRDSKGRITSHLSGLFYRNINLLENGVKPIFVFDGEPPKFKRGVVEARKKVREEARKKWEKAVEEGRKEDVMVYAQASAKLTDFMIEESKQLLDYMGIPWVQAKSEGEAQAVLLAKKGDVYAVGSQDFDSLLFGGEVLVRNLSISGKKKLPRKEKWVEVTPEIIKLKNVLSELGLNQEQLIIVGMLIGTDYNPGGIKGVGPKTALKLTKENKTLDGVLKKIEWGFENDPHEIFDFFINPPAFEDYSIEAKDLDLDKVRGFLMDHDFSEARVDNGLNVLKKNKVEGAQTKLENWFKK